MKSTIVKFTTKPEHKDTFAATLKEAQAATKKKLVIKRLKYLYLAEDNVFFVYERWET
jgi:quinol monooxygenase YgiN